MMTNDFLEQVFGDDHHFTYFCTTTTFPIVSSWLVDSNSNIGHIGANGQTNVTR